MFEFYQGKLAQAKHHAEASYRLFPELRSNVELLMSVAIAEGDEKASLRYEAEAELLQVREAEAASDRS